ncbi:MAG: hypothetical protein RIQ60_3933 [Pseudomonadota bacterium]|jgi:thiol-disulfide isomerase/thioredoxin
MSLSRQPDDRSAKPDAAVPAAAPVLLACLCAAWCRTCAEYRATFEAVAAEFGPSALTVRWVDIEDDEQTLGGVDVVDFPTLLIAPSDDHVSFFGPVLPHAQTVRALLQRAVAGELDAVSPAERADLAGLPQRLRALD